jgi:TonB family protein
VVRAISTSLIAGLLSIGLPGESAAQARQSHAAFETAIRDNSTSPYVVLITVVDDRTGQTSSGCNTANLLRGAIYLEKWGSIDRDAVPEARSRHNEVEKIALENTSHIFHFSNPAALKNILPFRYWEACAAIEQGSRVRIGDRSGQIILGPFVEGPNIDRSSCPPPTYPKPNNEGGTTVALLVGQDGKLKESKLTESSGSAGWDEAVLAALSACRFSPRTIDGEPVPEATWMTISMGNRARW